MAQDTSTSTLQTLSNPDINAVSVKLPFFWADSAEMWFVQAESQFKLSNITADNTKLNYVIAALGKDDLAAVSDLILNPPTEKAYDTLKDRLITQFSQSTSARIKKLLSGLDLGDKKPSNLLYEMKNLAAGKIDNEMLKTLWLQRLPINVQQILALSSDELTKLAQMADQILEISDTRYSISAISSNANLDADLDMLKKQILTLTEKVNTLSKYLRRSGNSRSRSTSKNKSNKVEDPKMCWFHKTFAEKARRCIPPCSFQKNE